MAAGMKKGSSEVVVLLVGPFSSRGGGVREVVDTISSSPLMEKYHIRLFDIGRRSRGSANPSSLHIRNLACFIGQLARFALELARVRPSVVHLPVTSGWSFWKCAVMIALSRIAGAGVLAHIHGGNFPAFWNSSPRFARRLVLSALLACSKVIVLSKWWRRFFVVEVCLPAENIEVLANSYSYCFEKDLGQSKAEADQRPEALLPYFLFVGAIGERKGVLTILEAVDLAGSALDLYRIVFAGAEREAGALSAALEYTDSLGISERVEFVGLLSGMDKAKVFAEAFGFLLPSYIENLPISLLEALRAGLPVITTPVGGIPDVVTHEQSALIIQPGDAAALATAMVTLVEDEDLRRRLSEVGTQTAVTRYSPSVFASSLDRIYGEAVSNGGGSGGLC